VLAVEAIAWVVMLAAWWMLENEVDAFRWNRPDHLTWILAGPFLALIFLADLAWRNRAIQRFAAEDTAPRMVPGISTVRHTVRFLLLRHALSFAVIALAGPQFGSHPVEVKAKGIDLVLAVDVSNSMECEDFKPSRMEAARRAIDQLIQRMRGDRLGIVVFAGEAYVQLPITTDRGAARLFARTIGTSSVNAQGTALGAAIDLAVRCFDEESAASKAIIVITDGEDHEGDAIEAARRAQEAGIVVHAVGMGTPQGGPLPIRKNGQLQGFRKNRDGATVVSRLDEGMLAQIASEGGGAFVRATAASSGIQELVDELRKLDQTETGTVRYTAHDDQYQWPLGLAVALLFLHLLLGEQRNPRTLWRALTQ
jgi:Ca-activated chloride channel family protein